MTLLFSIQLFTAKLFTLIFFSTEAIKHQFILKNTDLIVFKGTSFPQQCRGQSCGSAHQRELRASRNASHSRARRRIPSWGSAPRSALEVLFKLQVRLCGLLKAPEQLDHVPRDPASTLKCSAGQTRAQ